MATVIEKRHLTEITKLFVVSSPRVAHNARPGQFVVIRVSETGERVPISITNFDAAAGTITLVVQEVGRTSGLICALEEGDEILDFAGPLGLPVALPESGHAVLVGGGFGAGAVFPLARELRARGVVGLCDRRRAHRRARDPARAARAGERQLPRLHRRRLARLPRLRERPARGADPGRRRLHQLLRGRARCR